jgi:methionyl-tRNA formyltransferase
MSHVVFFGMDGLLSTTTLMGLIELGVRPNLVVVGYDQPRDAFIDQNAYFPDRPSRLRSLVQRVVNDPYLPPNSLLGRMAHEASVPVLLTSNVNSTSARRCIAGVKPQAFVVAGFPHLLSPKTLGLSVRGGLNLHPGRLPEERGPAPLFWALKEGRRDALDFTIHQLDAQADHGPIAERGRIPVILGESLRQILERMAHQATDRLHRSLEALLAGQLISVPQEPSAQRPRRRPTFRDGRIQPDRPAEVVFQFVSACSEAYSLFFECGDDRFFVADALAFDSEAKLPSEYVLTGDTLRVGCQPGVVTCQLKANGSLFGQSHGPDETP